MKEDNLGSLDQMKQFCCSQQPLERLSECSNTDNMSVDDQSFK